MGINSIFLVTLILSIFTTSLALKCYLCGQYNDGVGSITPCINHTHIQLKECPQKEHVYCIKYVSEGSLVRDCVARCSERETWSAKTFCCNEDGCNSTTIIQSGLMLIIGAIFFVLVH